MTNEEDTKEQDTDESQATKDAFSLEDIDKLLEEDDPEFSASLEVIKSDDSMKDADIESLDVDSIGKEEAEEEPEEVKDPTGIDKVKLKIKSSVKKAWTFINEHRVRTQNTIVIGFRDFIIYMRTGFPERLQYFKKVIREKITTTIEFLKLFKELNWKQKTLIVLSIPLSLITLLLLHKTLTGGWLPEWKDPLLPSFHSVAEKVFEYDPKLETRDFYAAFPQNEFTVQMDKVVVNFKRHSRSGPNPMGTFEFFVSADAQETAIELKDRQREFLDQAQRALEEFSYEEAITQNGKRRMKEAIRKTLNQFLNQGRVNFVYFNNFIVKP